MYRCRDGGKQSSALGQRRTMKIMIQLGAIGEERRTTPERAHFKKMLPVFLTIVCSEFILRKKVEGMFRSAVDAASHSEMRNQSH